MREMGHGWTGLKGWGPLRRGAGKPKAQATPAARTLGTLSELVLSQSGVSGRGGGELWGIQKMHVLIVGCERTNCVIFRALYKTKYDPPCSKMVTVAEMTTAEL